MAFTPDAPREVPASAERHESVYLGQEHHAELLRPDANGLPPLYLARHNGALWFCEVTTGKLVNVDNRYLARMGIWGAKLRGHSHYEGQAALGPAELVREPDNPHDSSAVAVHADGQIVGYYNKGKARSLAKLLDEGEPLVARFVSVDPPKVLAAREDVIRHLYRNL